MSGDSPVPSPTLEEALLALSSAIRHLSLAVDGPDAAQARELAARVAQWAAARESKGGG